MLTRSSDDSAALTNVQKLLLAAGAVICYGLWHALRTSLGLPTYPGITTSLTTQPFIAWAILIIGIPLISLLISTLVGRVRAEAGLFCCAIGLVSLPAHGGDIRNALLDAGSPAIYARLAIEAAVLGAIWIGASLLFERLAGKGLLAPSTNKSDEPDTLGDRLTVVVLQALAMLVVLMLLCQSPVKGQALATACLAGVVSSALIHQSHAVRGSVWYIAGTMLAGVIAYLYTGLFSAAGHQIGDVRGLLAGPSRVLPLHYATLGIAGAIFGYWTSITWHAAKKAKAAEAEAAA